MVNTTFGENMRDNIDIARELIKEAKEFNLFGPVDANGSKFSVDLRRKYEAWQKDNSIEFTPKELKLLKPVIAQSMIGDELMKYTFSPSVESLPPMEKIKIKTIQSLNLAKTFAKCGSFNCEIAHIIVYLALVQKLSIPLEVILYSGVRNDGQDTEHVFATLGTTSTEFLSTNIKRRQQEHKQDSYILCDPHHSEAYPVSQALTELDKRLARYDNIDDSKKPPRVIRFLYLPNPKEFYNDTRISRLCEEVLKNKNDMTIKRKVEQIFNEIKQKSASKASIKSLVAMKQTKKEESAESKIHTEFIINKLTDMLKLQKNLLSKKKKPNQVWELDHSTSTQKLKLSGLLFPNENSISFCTLKLERNGFVKEKDFTFTEVVNGGQTSKMLCILNLGHPSLQANIETTVSSLMS